LEKEIAVLESHVEQYEDGSGKAKRFIQLVERHVDFTELTAAMLNEFVSKMLPLRLFLWSLMNKLCFKRILRARRYPLCCVTLLLPVCKVLQPK